LTDARPVPTAGGEWDEHGVGLAGCHFSFLHKRESPSWGRGLAGVEFFERIRKRPGVRGVY
jgi:hypothetical protein